MVDNLKQRIAEALRTVDSRYCPYTCSKVSPCEFCLLSDKQAQAVLDIVEPMLTGLVGLIGSQQQTNQALIERIPKWMPIDDNVPKDKWIHISDRKSVWCARYHIIDNERGELWRTQEGTYIQLHHVTLYQLLPTPPEK